MVQRTLVSAYTHWRKFDRAAILSMATSMGVNQAYGTTSIFMSRQVEHIIVDGFTVVVTNDSDRAGRESIRKEIKEAARKAREEFRKKNDPKST